MFNEFKKVQHIYPVLPELAIYRHIDDFGLQILVISTNLAWKMAIFLIWECLQFLTKKSSGNTVNVPTKINNQKANR